MQRDTWRKRIVAASIAAFGAALLVGCGGGGGGGDDGGGGGGGGDDPAPAMPANVAWSGGLLASTSMTLETPLGTLTLTALDFEGTWNRSSDAYTLGSRTGVAVDLGAQGGLRVGVLDPVAWTLWEPPQAGTFEALATSVPPAQGLFPGIAMLEITANALPVRLKNDAGASADFSWEQFLDGSALTESWQQGIWTGYGVMTLATDRVRLALELLEFLNANDAALKAAGASGLTAACANGTGTRKVVWTDANADGALGPSDTFTQTFAGCLVDVPGNDVDEILDGTIRISGYIENAGPPWSVGGRVDFVGLKQTETGTGGFSTTLDGSANLFVTTP